MTFRPLRRVAAGLTALGLAATMLAAAGTAAEAAPKKNGRAKASFSSTQLIAGAGVLAVKGTWVTLKTKKSKKNGRFAIATPFNWYGSHKMRVTTRGFTKAKRIRVATAYTPYGNRKSYVLRGKRLSSTPRFNPCQTLRYQVNAAQVPPSALGIVQATMAQISAASGIKMKYVGSSSYTPFTTKKLPKRKADLTIAWANNGQVTQFAQGVAVGLGGELRAYYARDSAGRRAVMTDQAGVTLQTESYNTLFTEANESGPANPPVSRLILHEVGHALGLRHAPASDQVMYYTQWTPEADGLVHARYGAGDLAGLKKVGLQGGCVRALRRSGRYVAAPVAAPVVDAPSLAGHRD